MRVPEIRRPQRVPSSRSQPIFRQPAHLPAASPSSRSQPAFSRHFGTVPSPFARLRGAGPGRPRRAKSANLGLCAPACACAARPAPAPVPVPVYLFLHVPCMRPRFSSNYPGLLRGLSPNCAAAIIFTPQATIRAIAIRRGGEIFPGRGGGGEGRATVCMPVVITSKPKCWAWKEEREREVAVNWFFLGGERRTPKFVQLRQGC